VKKISSVIAVLAVLAAAVVFLQARSGEAADVTFDAASACTPGNDTSFTWSHTVGNGNERLLLVGLSLAPRLNQKVQTILYGGQPLTLVAFRNNSNDSRAEVWQLVAPASGTNNIIVVMSAATAVETCLRRDLVDRSGPGRPDRQHCRSERNEQPGFREFGHG
jgi:hypothetical protein